MAAGTVFDPTYQQVAAINGDATKAGIDALAFLSKWGFDSQHRSLAKTNLYTPPTIPHPLIKNLKTICEVKRIIRNKMPVLVEFYSPQCPSCKKSEGPLTAVTEQNKTAMKVYTVDKDKDELYDLIEIYDINLIPAFMLFKNGKEINRIEGKNTLPRLRELVKKGLSRQRALKPS